MLPMLFEGLTVIGGVGFAARHRHRAPGKRETLMFVVAKTL
jgi:hypothetical protein